MLTIQVLQARKHVFKMSFNQKRWEGPAHVEQTLFSFFQKRTFHEHIYFPINFENILTTHFLYRTLLDCFRKSLTEKHPDVCFS